MNEALRLARRDLRGGLGGLGLLWICLAIAVSAIASVTSLAAAIDGAIAANGRAMTAGDLVLRTAQREANADELAAMRALGPVTATITMRAMVIASNGDSTLAELSGVEPAWPMAGALVLAPGGHRPRGAEVALGRELAERLAVQRGDTVRIGYARLTVSGIVQSMPAMSGFALAPPVLVDPAALRATGLVQPGSLTTANYQLLLPANRDPEAVGRAFQARFPDGGWSARDRKDAGNGMRRFIERVGQMLLLVALAALAIGALGIASAAAAFAASRKTTVATLKLLGAGRAMLAAMLAIEVAGIALLAILAGLLVGALTPLAVTPLLAGALPIPPDPTPQWRALGEAALFGLLVTVGAAWGPLSEAVATRPAALLRGEADDRPAPARLWVPALAFGAAALLAVVSASEQRFALYGVAAIAGVALLFAGIGLLLRVTARRLRHRGGPIVRLGIAALDRPGAATIRLAVALGVGLSLLVALAGVAQSLLRALDEDVPARAPALFLIDLPPAQEGRFRALAQRQLPDAELRLVPSLRGRVTAVKGVPAAQIGRVPQGGWVIRGDRGLTFLRTLPAGNRIVAGKWWPADYRGPPLISLDANAAQGLGLRVGDTMTIAVLGRPIEARITSLRTIDWRSLGFNFAIIFAPGTLEQAPFTLMATVAPQPGASTTGLERALAAELPMVSAIRVADLVAQVRSILETLHGAVRIATAVALLLGVIVLAGAVVATRRARARDMVLLKLVGASRGEVLGTQVVEFALLGSAVTLAAFGAGTLAARLVVTRSFELPFEPHWPTLLGLAVGAILVTVGAALAAAFPALRARPAAALRAL